MREYYGVPFTVDEIYRLQFVDGSNFNFFFENLLKSTRPRHIAPLILFERDSDYPNELFALVYNEDGDLMNYIYISEEDTLFPLLKKYKRTRVIPVDLHSFHEFKRGNSRLKDLKIRTPILSKVFMPSSTQTQTLSISSSSSSSTMDPMIYTLLFLFLTLCLFLLVQKRKRQPVPELSLVRETLKSFLPKIVSTTKRNKFAQLIQNLETEKVDVLLAHLEKSFQDPVKEQAVLKFLNEAQENKDIQHELEQFFSSVRDGRTRRLLRHIVQQTAEKKWRRSLPSMTKQQSVVSFPKSQQLVFEPSIFEITSLYQFLNKNKQHMVSSNGAVSPVFADKLEIFLKENHAPTNLKQMVIQKARGLIRQKPSMTHRQLTDQLLHSLTQQSLSVRPVFVMSPVSKRPLKKKPLIVEKQQLLQQQQQQLQQKQQQKKQQIWQQVVERTAKPSQKELGIAIMEKNIQDILHHSKTYRKIVPTLCQVIQTRQIRNVFVIDAPNLLTASSKSFRQRQEYSKDPQFVQQLFRKLGDDPQNLMLIVSQMNHKDWKNNDPISFSRVDPDERNTFLVRVGCFDDANNVDCHRSKDTQYHNECDDFVRLDLMGRIILTLSQEDVNIPQFVHVSRDRGRNWRFLSPVVQQYISSKMV